MKKKYLFILLVFFLKQDINAQWVSQTSGSASSLLSISFPSQDTGYVVQDNGILFKTVNGGANWNLVSTTPMFIGSNVLFTSDNIGFSFYNDTIYKSIDGGLTWNNTQFFSNVLLNNMVFVDPNNGFAIGTNLSYDSIVTLKTVNAGNTWSLVSITNNTDFVFAKAFSFPNLLEGFYSSGFGDIYKTIDGGITWNLNYTNWLGTNFIQFLDANNGYAACDAGTVLKTIDGGGTWTSQTTISSLPFYGIQFTNINNGYVCGGDGMTSGIILKTNNGGSTWTTSLTSSHTFAEFSFPTSSVGYVCGTNGDIHKNSTLTGIDNFLQKSSFHVYPNPSNGVFTIEGFQKQENVTVAISDILGNNVIEKQSISNLENYKIDISDQPKGFYFVKVESEGEISVLKIICE